MQAAGDFPPILASQYPAFLEALMAGHRGPPALRPPPAPQHPGSAGSPPPARRRDDPGRPQRRHMAPGCRRRPVAFPADAQSLRPPRPRNAKSASPPTISSRPPAAPDVVLTRSRAWTAPHRPSRWLLRLDTVLRGLNLHGIIDAEAEQWLSWVEQLDRPEEVRPVQAPEPRPPLSARPRSLRSPRSKRGCATPTRSTPAAC